MAFGEQGPTWEEVVSAAKLHAPDVFSVIATIEEIRTAVKEQKGDFLSTTQAEFVAVRPALADSVPSSANVCSRRSGGPRTTPFLGASSPRPTTAGTPKTPHRRRLLRLPRRPPLAPARPPSLQAPSQTVLCAHF